MTEEEANWPIGPSATKFTKTQAMRFGELAQWYLWHLEDAKGKEENGQAIALQQLYERPAAIQPREEVTPTPLSETQPLMNSVNAAIVAGQMATRIERQQALSRLEAARQDAQNRGQTARRRSIS